MTESFDINTKFYAHDGVLGRRDYCVNIIYISAISLLINCPFLIYWLFKCSSLADIFKYDAIFVHAPLMLKLLTILTAAAVVTIFIPTIKRRVRDICAETNNYWTTICTIILGLSQFWFIFSLPTYLAIQCVASITGLCLLFMPGKVTSRMPYDYTKDFNWGAFFGTWIWGLYNKSYITLFAWAVNATPFSGLFAIYCGLKGNEWAYKGKKWNDVREFNKSQKRQAIFFICLVFLIIPAIIILPIVILVALIAAAGCGNCDNSPQVDKIATPPAIEQQVQQKKSDEKIELDNCYKFMANIYFDSYEFTEDEYSFYVSESDWKTYTIFDKLDLMSKAQKISKGYRYKVNQIKYPNQCRYSSGSDEIEKIKLYSTEKHQLLGEFNKEIDLNNASAKYIFMNMFKIFKFYEIEK